MVLIIWFWISVQSKLLHVTPLVSFSIFYRHGLINRMKKRGEITSPYLVPLSNDIIFSCIVLLIFNLVYDPCSRSIMTSVR